MPILGNRAVQLIYKFYEFRQKRCHENPLPFCDPWAFMISYIIHNFFRIFGNFSCTEHFDIYTYGVRLTLLTS